MSVKPNSKVMAAMSGAALAVLCGFCLQHFRAGAGLASLSYDLLLVARGDMPVREAVIVYLDEQSHQKLNQPLNAPWDRALHAQLIQRLTAAGASAIVFDIVFSDPDKRNPEKDQLLASAMKASGRVVLGADNVLTGPKKKEMTPPFDLLLDSAAAVGSVEVVADRDLIVREHTPEEQIPSLSWAAAEFLKAPSTQDAKARGVQRWLNYYGPPNSIPGKSYWEVLEPGRMDDDVLRGKVVFVGAKILTKFAGERKDEYRNPFSFWLSQETTNERGALFIPGVEIQATAFANLMRGDWMTRFSPRFETVALMALGLLFGVGLILFRPVMATTIALLGLAVVVAASFLLFRTKLIWFPWLIVSVQVVLALSWSVLFNSVQLYVQKKLYEQTLAFYLSPKLVKKFSRNSALLKPGAEKQHLTLFFSDIADFTSISEGMDPDVLATLMNEYFQAGVSKCIHHTDGTVVKYIGDAIFSFWNAPDAQPDHALRACEAALRFREVKVSAPNGRPLLTRIGLHTGEANVGNFGSFERVDYTALGENVNLASRLEGLNKYLGTERLMSGATRAGIGERLVTRAVGSFHLKGFEKPVEVHELVDWPDEAEASRPWREVFAQALKNFQSGDFMLAEMGFRQTLELRPDDGPSCYYLGRIEEIGKQPLSGDWTGATIMKEK